MASIGIATLKRGKRYSVTSVEWERLQMFSSNFAAYEQQNTIPPLT